MHVTTVSPRSGPLAGPSDLEQIMSLDDWLSRTDEIRKSKQWDDAWADRSTNCAFAFNNTIGVEKAHASNVWVNSWDGEEDVPNPNLDKKGHGLYVHVPRPPIILELLNEPQITRSDFANDEFHNTSGVDMTETRSYEEEQGEEVSLSVTRSIGFNAKGNFELDGFQFDVETSLDQSRTDANTQSSIAKSNQTITILCPTNKTTVFTRVVFTTKQDIRYGLDVELGEASPGGSIWWASTRGHRGSWGQVMKLADVLAFARQEGMDKQRIEWKVRKTTKSTKVFVGEKQADGSVSWTGENGAPPA